MPFEKTPWDDFNPYEPYKPRQPKKKSIEDFIGSDIKALKELLDWILGDSGVASSLKDMKKSQKLKGTVKRNERVYEVIITDITPDPEDVPDEVSIEWVADFGDGHEDLTE